MEPFSTLVATAAPLDATNVDTDQIIPARFLKSPRAGGYGQFLFHDLRFAADGTPRPGFVLDEPARAGAKILVANANFGCGSSREGAVYALWDYGFRCVIAPGINDIFYTNSLRNGLLPARVTAEEAAQLRSAARAAPDLPFAIDLERQTIAVAGLAPIAFFVEPFGKACLLRGLDDIAFTLEFRDAIDAHMAQALARQPWLAGR